MHSSGDFIPRPSPQPAVDARAGVVYAASRAGLSGRGRAIAWLLAILLLVGCVLTLAAADALPITGGRVQSAGNSEQGASPVQRTGERAEAEAHNGTPLAASVIQAEWDGPAVHLDWTNSEYARAETTFIGDRVTSPGDRVVRTLNVVNAGPGDGVAKVTIDLHSRNPEDALNPGLANDVTIFWDVEGVTGEESFASLLPGGRVAIAEVAVPHGGAVAVTVGFAVDVLVETSRALGAESSLLSFDVGVDLSGNTEPPVTPTLPMTGLTGVATLAGLAAAVLLLGWLLLFWRRRRVCDDCDRVIPRDESWFEHRGVGTATRVQCESCHSLVLA